MKLELFLFAFLLLNFLLMMHPLISKALKPIATTTEQSDAPVVKQTAMTWVPSIVKRLLVLSILFVGCLAIIFCAVRYYYPSYTSYPGLAESHYSVSKGSNHTSDGTEEPSSGQNENYLQLPDKINFVDVLPADKIKTTFKDVAGLTEPKEEIQDLVAYLKSPQSFSRLGAKMPKGVLMYGPPGTGKTLLARALAGEANAAFISASGSMFEEEFVGIGSARIRNLFKLARKHAPCIIFIDEIDSLAGNRYKHDISSGAQTVNQLLTELDGLDEAQNEGILLIGATNRYDAMDQAVLRPGRIDRKVKLDLPTSQERVEILNIHLKKIEAKDIQVELLAKLTPGFSGADLANIVNEAAIIATKANQEFVTMENFSLAKDKIILGNKRSALKLSPENLKITAYHEAGHALVGSLLQQHDPLYKVTILPRGMSLGHTNFEADEDIAQSKSYLEQRIMSLLAGHLAEKIVFGDQKATIGASSDFKQATNIALNMVTKWGFSEKLGPIYLEDEQLLYPKEVVEAEVQAILSHGETKTRAMLQQHRSKLNALADALLEHETLTRAQVETILAGKEL